LVALIGDAVRAVSEMSPDYPENVNWLQQKPLLHERLSSRFKKRKSMAIGPGCG